MKKFISMVMAAAMVVSLVPATAFAANEATFKVVGDKEWTETTVAEENQVVNGPQIQIKIKDVDTEVNVQDKYELKLSFDNLEAAKGVDYADETKWSAGRVVRTLENKKVVEVGYVEIDALEEGDDVINATVFEGTDDGSNVIDFVDGDMIVLELDSNTMVMPKTSAGSEATVKVTGDFGSSDELTVAAVLDEGIEAEVDDTVDVAVEEIAVLEDITVEPAVGDTFAAVLDNPSEITLKLNKGFEFVTAGEVTYKDADDVNVGEQKAKITDDDEITLVMKGWELDAKKIVFSGIKIEATTADEGDVAVVTVKADDCDSVKLEVATVCDFKVVMSVDEDEDVPVYYSGVNVANKGLTVDDDHESLEVTIKETFAGAWSMHKDFSLSLPEGVYVTEVDVEDENTTLGGNDALYDEFVKAYVEGEHVFFDFAKRTFAETEPEENNGKEHEMTVVMTLVADPGFVGDVVLTLEGDALETQEVTIAKFVAPAIVKAEQNDLKIDYRYTEVGSDIVVTEAEAGLWAEGLTVGFAVERGDMIQFEDDATFTVNEDSDMEIDDFTGVWGEDDDEIDGTLGFEVEEESDEEAAVVTISNVELFMQRNIPAGAYDLEMFYGLNKDFAAYNSIVLLGQTGEFACDHDDCDTHTIDDICDYETVVKEGWINVVTAGREADDASFTTKVVVPVGEAYIIAGETQVALDVPAYVNAAGYTMLPVRAVAVALGINTQNVLWDQATKTVTILYGQRIITMQVGAKVVYVNGSAIPASASVEIVDGRTFLPMRDLATALGVTDITWDAATKTATLNGNA